MFVGFDVILKLVKKSMCFSEDWEVVILVSTLNYCMVCNDYLWSITGSFGSRDSSSRTSNSCVMKAVFYNSSIASKIMVICSIAGILTSWNSFYVGGSRAIYAMAEVKMLPKILAVIHPKYKTPVNAILIIGIL